MWTRKAFRDLKKNVDSPMPTQVVSNEEFVPRPQTPQQKQVETLIGEMADERSKKLGMSRRAFMASSMGMATCFLASNEVYGKTYWDVDPLETWEAQATAERFPKGQYFVFDVQAHFTNGQAIGFRDLEWVRGMGFKLSNDAESYGYRNFVKEMFFDSETEMIVISGVPGKENHRGPDGRILERAARAGRGAILPSWLMAEARTELNQIAGSTRVLAQGNCAPNHYWNTATNSPDYPALFEQMEREVNLYKINSWKWYCHTDPGRSGGGFQLDDEMSARFYEQSRKLGLRLFSVHKGYSSQSRTLGHLANPKDVEQAALKNPDLTFVIYHSAMKHGVDEPDFTGAGKNEFNPATGDFQWHQVLMDIRQRNPKMTNVYAEIGSFLGPLAIVHPEMAMHGMGKNIKYFGSDHVIWGTDCLWYGSPQWVIDALKRFQISDELCEKFGYQKITEQDKANIFGLNAARVYGVDVKAKRSAFPADTLSRLKAGYLADGGMRDNGAWGWVRAHD